MSELEATTTQRSEQRAAQQVRFWMSAPTVTIQPDAPISEALAVMHEHSIRRLPVVYDDGRLCGIITEGDLRGAGIMQTAGFDERLVAAALGCTAVFEVMTEQPLWVEPGATLREAALLMLDNKIGGLPVVENDIVTGIVTESDLFEALVCYLDGPANNG